MADRSTYSPGDKIYRIQPKRAGLQQGIKTPLLHDEIKQSLQPITMVINT
ncbi:MAG: hypothetical protein AB2551_08640 [Candidatus Thiodiazotropha sp.]